MNHFIKRFDEPMRALSNAPHNGGLFRAGGFFFMHVHKNYRGDYREDCLKFEHTHALKGFVGFMTAANIPEILSVAKSGNVEAYITAGITNPAIAGDDIPKSQDMTINMALIIREGLTIGGMANSIMTATEAKTYTLLNLGYKATGTTSDGIGIFAFEGNNEWAGTATALGRDIGRTVRGALENSIKKWERLRG